MFDVTHLVERAHTMTRRQAEIAPEMKAVLSEDGDFLRNAVKAAIQAALEAG